MLRSGLMFGLGVISWLVLHYRFFFPMRVNISFRISVYFVLMLALQSVLQVHSG